jgi:hypothetical protein
VKTEPLGIKLSIGILVIDEGDSFLPVGKYNLYPFVFEVVWDTVLGTNN